MKTVKRLLKLLLLLVVVARVFYFYGVSDMKRLSFEDKLLFSFWGFMVFMCVAVIAAGIVLNEVLP